MTSNLSFSRRQVLMGMGGTVLAAAATGPAFAQAAYPSRPFSVIVPTAQGGGADVLLRAFAPLWSGRLRQPFEFTYEPAASGQVAYELYVGQRERDGHNLLFGNMGPELVMYATQSPNYRYPEDITYLFGVDIDDCGIFALKDSPFQTIGDVIEEGKKRTLNVSVTRLPHPGTIGLLLLAEQTGAKFNIIPYGGGNPAITAVLNGEVDIGGGGISGVPNEASGALRVLTIFNRSFNQLAAINEDAPLANEALGTDLPDLYTTRAIAVHTEWANANPDGVALLKSVAQDVFADPQLEANIRATPQPWEAVKYLDQEACAAYAQGVLDVATRFKDQLSA